MLVGLLSCLVCVICSWDCVTCCSLRIDFFLGCVRLF